ncbi:Protein CBG25709 [Caenorhabditis briggsae]|uniref:Protein CBG25709 n=1 Tax=Caenorhabditis briggsae TaxID=6238 RepID=B6IGX2_CAEBR|nr:Protein CBG25709 [Caenorhabditis briggsae]CAR99152.1 Protein CBG25709 [Caenorhabditis briggsae]
MGFNEDSPEPLWLTIYLPSLPYLSASSIVPTERRPEFLQLSLTCSEAPIVPEFSDQQQKLYDFAFRCSQFCLLYQKPGYNVACLLFDPKKLEIPQIVQNPMNEKELFVRWFVLRSCVNEGTASDYWDKSRHQNHDFLFWTWKLKAVILKNTHEDQLKQGFIFLDSDQPPKLPELPNSTVALTPKLTGVSSFWYLEDPMIKDKSSLFDPKNPKKPQLVKQPADEKELYVQYSIETEKCYRTTRERAELRWEERKNAQNGLLYVTWKVHAVKLRLEHEDQIRKNWIIVKSHQ